MDGGAAEVGAIPLLRGRDKLGEVQLLVNLNQQTVWVDEVPQAFAGEPEEGAVPAAAVQRFEHRHFSQ